MQRISPFMFISSILNHLKISINDFLVGMALTDSTFSAIFEIEVVSSCHVHLWWRSCRGWWSFWIYGSFLLALELTRPSSFHQTKKYRLQVSHSNAQTQWPQTASLTPLPQKQGRYQTKITTTVTKRRGLT